MENQGVMTSGALLARGSSSPVEVFSSYARALTELAERDHSAFSAAIELILNTDGRVVVSGIGKSGLIGRKIAATLSSTGTPSLFLHSAEAFHGDLGVISHSDIAVLISYSGETEEVVKLIAPIKRRGVKIIAITGDIRSTLAQAADIVLDAKVEREVCPHNLAPTTSCIATLAIGDALAVELMHKRQFAAEDFGFNHPGGSLGRRLHSRVRDMMHKGALPIVTPDASMQSVIFTMTRGRLGMALVMNDDELAGVITDGDLRRILLKHENLSSVTAKDAMTPQPQTISQDAMWVEAEARMIERKISSLVVIDDQRRVVGIAQVYGQ